MHHLHVWSLTFDNIFLSAHIIAEQSHHADVLTAAEHICNSHGIGHTTIQMDSPLNDCTVTTRPGIRCQ
jgi:Co/Zn/Cd efflux system component